MKGGQYLKGEKIGPVIGYIKEEKEKGAIDIGAIFKGKDLKADENVAIRQIKKINNCIDEERRRLNKEVELLKNISKKLKYACKYKDYFETENYFYLVLSYYDDNLENFFQMHNKKLSPNLIKKIFKQLNLIFEELLFNFYIVQREMNPENILIKYWNEGKTIFDCTLSYYAISEEYEENHLISMGTVVGVQKYIPPEILHIEKNNYLLFNIGMLMYYLYFGKYPFGGKNMPNRLYSFNNNFTIEEDKELEDLLKKLLKENTNERITWKEYFAHPFFKQYEY